jgi:hypothetical protein
VQDFKSSSQQTTSYKSFKNQKTNIFHLDFLTLRCPTLCHQTKNRVFHVDLLVSTAAMSWANPVVASLALGDVVPKMKGLVLKLGHG